MTDKAKKLSKTTADRIKKYVLLAESVLLAAAGLLALSEARGQHGTVRSLAVVAGVYAVIEAVVKLDRVVSNK